MGQFDYLKSEFNEIHQPAHRSEALANSDPRAAAFYARRTLELAITWAYRADSSLQLPYRNDLNALIHEPSFQQLVGQAVFQKCRAIKNLGNHAVHSHKQISVGDATAAVRELFHVCYWLARTYAKGEKPEPGLTFDPSKLPVTKTVTKQSYEQLQEANKKLDAERERLLSVLAEKENLDEELKKLRAEVAAIKATNEATPDTHNYSEAETRDLFIDLLLKEAGWNITDENREYEVVGMPNSKEKGYVDYVLWGDDGKPLALIEAKCTRHDSRKGQQQAKLYAGCLEKEFGRRPIIFYTNGYDHWIWDDSMYPPRAIQGFYTKDELQLLIQRRKSRRSLAAADISSKIVERHYQTRAIRRIAESFEKDRQRKALLVMATGAGKTRTVIALADMMMRSNWVRRVLFLADRTALVNQTVNAFKRFLPESAPVNLVTEKNAEGRIYVSTYPTMIGLIDETKGEKRRFGPGHFDLVIIDEAHRSVFLKYKAIFDYFDSYLVGLTATPKDEVDRNTYGLFDLEDGVPTDAYSLDEAVADGYLVPARSVSVPLKLPREGITYANLSEEEKEQFELTDWKERSEDVLAAGRIEPEAVNKWLFNKSTVDKVLKHVMERGQKFDGGDRLGKTIIFAKNHEHAMFIAERFDANYPKEKGHFARVIDYRNDYAQSLIDSFSDPSKSPHIAISVDMLDTGIDIPEVVNLVFFKQVHSKTKFWQMVGRGTRLCPDLFGPGKDKEFFYIFDYLSNLEFFSQDLPSTDGSVGASLSKHLFVARLRVMSALLESDGTTVVKEVSAQYGDEPETDSDVLTSIRELLHAEVGAMNTDNFIVRTKRRLVERFQDASRWTNLSDEDYLNLQTSIAGLPAETPREPVESKRFDLLVLRLQLAILTSASSFKRLSEQVQGICSVLEEHKSIPMISKHIELIKAAQAEEWWQDVTVPMLEQLRLRLRGLVTIVQHPKGSPVYTDFEDELGEEELIELPAFRGGASFERFKEKARAFLREHLDSPAVIKLRMNEPLTSADLDELESLLREPASNAPDLLIQAKQENLGLFVRLLVGLDRQAAQSALSQAINEQSLSGTQIEFVELIIDHLADHGVLDGHRLYESPFVDISPTGADDLFPGEELDQILQALTEVRRRAGDAGTV